MTAFRGCDDGPFGVMSRRSFYHARAGPRRVFRTDVHGDIEMSTDGERLWVEVGREGEREYEQE